MVEQRSIERRCPACFLEMTLLKLSLKSFFLHYVFIFVFLSAHKSMCMYISIYIYIYILSLKLVVVPRTPVRCFRMYTGTSQLLDHALWLLTHNLGVVTYVTYPRFKGVLFTTALAQKLQDPMD